MPTVTFILGLCGSGKSWIANRMSADIKFDEGFWLADRRGANMSALRAALNGGGNALVVEVAFCQEDARQEVRAELSVIPDVEVRWICIENALAVANENCQRRKGHRHAEKQVRINETLSRRYTYPAGADNRPMWVCGLEAAVTVGEPTAFSRAQLDDFVSLVLEGGEVQGAGLEERVAAAPQLAFLRLGDCLVGVGGLKTPSNGHRRQVEAGANFALPPEQVPYELGWIFILPSARNLKLSLPLCRPLVAAAGSHGVFATSRVSNVGMHRTLDKLGLLRQGAEWRSQLGNENLALFVRQTT